MNPVHFPGHDLKFLTLITTHFLASHRNFLENCWTILVTHPFFSNRTDFHFYTTPNDQTRLFNIDNYTARLRNIFSKVSFTHSFALDKQMGAKSVMHDMRMQPVFEKYEWIMRLNPDVIVLDARRIVKMMHMPHVDAIICNCNWRLAKVYNHTYTKSVVLARPWPKRPYYKIWPIVRYTIVNTDFILFRPRAIAIRPNHTHLNAEYDMTNLLQGNKNVAILSTTKSKHCRVNSDEVKHVHDISICRTLQTHNFSSQYINTY